MIGLIVDLFAGGGGASTGLAWALGRDPDIAINHDAQALATQRRIAEGLRRYVLQAADPFIVTYYGQKKPGDFRGQDLSRPLPTQTTENRFGLVSPVVVTNTSGHTPTPVDMPLPTLTTGNQQMVAGAVCIAKHYGTTIGQPAAEPLSTIAGHNKHSLVSACFTKYYGKSECAAVDAPLHTLTSKEHLALTSACLVKYYGTAKAADVRDPMHTITAKARMGLIGAQMGGEPGRYGQVRDFLRHWNVIGTDDEAEFVYQGVVHRITDILMRMLAPRELYTAQGFPPDYVIDRLPDGKRLTKTAQIRMCGNSVPPALVAALVKANGPATWAEWRDPIADLPLLRFARPELHAACAV